MKQMLLLRCALLPLSLLLASCNDAPSDGGAGIEIVLDHNQLRFELTQQLADNPDDQALRIKLAQTQLVIGDGIGAEATLLGLPEPARSSGLGAALLGHAALLQEKPEDALKLARQAGKGVAQASWVEVGALMMLEQQPEALARMTKALAEFPDDAPLLALRGEIALAERAIEPARDFAARALEADPASLAGLMLAGKLAALTEDWELAERHYSEAARQHGGVIAPLVALAATQADFGKVEEAGATLTALRKLAPSHPLGLLFEARLAFIAGDLEEAHAKMQQGEAQLRGVPAAQLLQGEIAHLRGNHEVAIAVLEPFVRSDPRHMQGAMVLAQSFVANDEPERALEVLKVPAAGAGATPQMLALASRLAKQNGAPDPYAARIAATPPPDDAPGRLAAADRAIAARDYETAYKTYAGLIKEGMGSDALVLNNGALMALNVGKSADALSFARRAHALTPDDAAVIHTLGWVLLETGENKAEALPLLRRAHELRPGNLEFRWHYAVGLAANGRKRDARQMAMTVREFAGPAQAETIDAFLARL